jgi:hypothetical protein
MNAMATDRMFVTHAPDFEEVIGDSPQLFLLAEVDAHEGPVYFAEENTLYFTTVPRLGGDRSLSVQIKRLPLDDPARAASSSSRYRADGSARWHCTAHGRSRAASR